VRVLVLVAALAIAGVVAAAAACSNSAPVGLDLNFPVADLPQCPTGYSRWLLLPGGATCGLCEAGSAYLLCDNGAWTECDCNNPSGAGTGVFCQGDDAGADVPTDTPIRDSGPDISERDSSADASSDSDTSSRDASDASDAG
jgi:hypothetical protein